MDSAWHGGWHGINYSTNGACYTLPVKPKMQGAKQNSSTFPMGRRGWVCPGGWLEEALWFPSQGALQGPAGKRSAGCSWRLWCSFWAGPQASKAQLILLKGSICSSLALWPRPPTKSNEGCGLASARSPKTSAAFLEKISLLPFYFQTNTERRCWL